MQDCSDDEDDITVPHGGAVEEFEHRYVRPMQGAALIVGSRLYGSRPDRRKLYRKAVGVDMLEGPGVDRVIDLEEPLPEGFGKFAHVECMSVLEHSRRPWLMAENIERLMKRGGTLFVTAPFVWRVHSYPSDYWRFTHEGIKALFGGIDFYQVMSAHASLSRSHRTPIADRTKEIGGHPYLARTEVCAFGVKR